MFAKNNITKNIRNIQKENNKNFIFMLHILILCSKKILIFDIKGDLITKVRKSTIKHIKIVIYFFLQNFLNKIAIK